LGALQKLHLRRDQYRFTAGAGYVNLNYKFVGIGSSSGNAGKSLDINQSGWGLVLEGLIHVQGKWYAGPRYVLVKTRIGLNPADAGPAESQSAAEEPTVPAIDIDLRTASLGPHIQRDSRDDEMYPKAGSLFNTQIGCHAEALGGNRKYESYQISFSKYHSLRRHQVIAVRGSGCFTVGSAPFYDLCGFQSKDVRGYAAGRYLDRDTLASQAEFRQELPMRLGVVVFAGAGGVAPKLSEFKFKELRPGAGAGLRFRLTKQNHINFSADYASGIGGRTLYVSVGEVF
jgi:outer membrane protein assembly factor BamA